MIKKSLATALLVCSIPAMANASWFLTTQVKNAGGTLTTSNATGQVVTDGVVTKSYKTVADETPSVTPAAGNTLRGLTVVDSTSGPAVPVTLNAGTFTPVDGHSYTVAASFQVSKIAVGASIAGGTVTPGILGNIYYGYKLTSPLTFTFSPAAGSYIDAISGAPAEATVTNPGGVNQKATVMLPTGYTFTGPISLQATTVNNTPAINRILPTTAVSGATVKLTASTANVSAPAYAWSYVSGPDNKATYSTVNGKVVTTVTPGPAITLAGDSTSQLSFTAPSKPGQYKFLVTVGSLTSMAVVNVVASSADAANQCQFCHTANGVAGSTATDNIGIKWAASVHGGSTSSSCASCHYGTGTGAHPGTVTAATVDNTTFTAKVNGVVGGHGTTINTGDVFCATCHTGSYPIPHPVDVVPPSPAAGLGTTCVSCHSTSDAHGIQPLATKLIPATGDYCINCHDNRNTSFKTSVHFSANGQNSKNECRFCHGFDGMNPTTEHGKAPSCDKCHGTRLPGIDAAFEAEGLKGAASACASCHAGGGHPHSIKTVAAAGLKKECLDCHAAPVSHVGSTNAGIRGVATEFGTKSHHIFNPLLADGVTVDPAGPQSKHCVVCHMEGTNDGTGKVAVDSNNHMKGYIALRDVDKNTVVKWNGGVGGQAEYTAMDNFCMACHDDNGASGIPSILALNSVATPVNPFGDQISNDYDQVKRSRVINVFSQFSTGNTSHHAVRAPRYKARTTADAVAAGKMVNSNPTTDKLAEKSVPVGGETGQNTLYSGGLFTSYVPQGDTLTVADNSQLHCGDCHTVGQLNYGADVADPGKPFNKIAIGAHGAVNAYMLRNSNGDNALHTKATYVCYNCHNNLANGYLNVPTVTQANTMATGFYNGGASAAKAGHDGVPSNCNVDVSTGTGVVYGAAGSRLTSSNSGNATGISCIQCHNNGRTGFGGIHGGNGYYTSTWVAYTSAAKTKSIASNNGGTAVPAVTPIQVEHRRFMGGMGNYGYKPAGGSWEWNGIGDKANPTDATAGGCYTNQAAGDNAGWSSCIHHSTSTGSSNQGTPSRKSSMGNVGRPMEY